MSQVATYNPPKVNIISPEGGTLQDYLERKDKDNMVAKLEKLNAVYVKEMARRRKIWRLCTMLSQKILPTLILYFLVSYWLAGICHYHRVKTNIILGTQVVFTLFYFTLVLLLNYAC